MRSYILLTAFVLAIMAVIGVQGTVMEEIIKTYEKCGKEAKISMESIKQLFQLKVQEEVKCHLKCVLESEKIWVNGSLNVAQLHGIIKHLPLLQKHENVMSQALSQCQNVESSGECDKAFATVKCVFKLVLSKSS